MCLSSLPGEFSCDEVLLEVIRCGNTSVFRYWKNSEKTETWYLKCLQVNPRLISYIDACDQTPTICDFVLSKSLDLFPSISQNFQTEQNCWAALEHNIAFILNIKSCTLAMVKYVLDKICDDTAATEMKDSFFQGLVDKIKDAKDLQWYAINRAIECKNAHVVFQIVSKAINWLDFEIIEHVLENCSANTICKCFTAFTSRLPVNKLQSLVLQFPNLISKCRVCKVPVNEEMSIRALQEDLDNYQDCIKTPKIVEFACQRKYNITYVKTNREQNLIRDMFFTCPELFQYAGLYAAKLIQKGVTLDFKKCSIIFSSAPEAELKNIFQLLDRPEYWLLCKCFYIACFKKRSSDQRGEIM